MASDPRGLDGKFWKMVDFGRECWEWKGSRDRKGYGVFEIPYGHHLFWGKGRGRTIKAHRFSYWRVKAAIPEGLSVLHSCDNPPCVRPEHLSVGTAKQNSEDMVRKNRQYRPIGEKNHRSSLSNERVRVIRERLERGDSCEAIGRDFSMSRVGVWSIKHGVTWKHLPQVPVEKRRRKKLNPEMVREIRAKDAAGVMGKDLAKEYGISKPTVSMIVNRKIWKDI